MYYVYIIKDEDGRLYVGYTKDIQKRIAEHNAGNTSSARGHKWELIYYEAYKSEEDARDREQKLKCHGRSKRWLKERIRRSINS
jgi:putative endonuclease